MSEKRNDELPESGRIFPGNDVSILYRNHRDETAYRTIQPIEIWFGFTKWHRSPQWLLRAIDVDKKAERDFAMCDILDWQNLSTSSVIIDE